MKDWLKTLADSHDGNDLINQPEQSGTNDGDRMKPEKFVIGHKFSWGPVVRVHEIGEHQIIEYHPEIFEKGCGTGVHEKEKVAFHVHGESVSYETLDQAIIGAICRKYDGYNTRADHYIFSMINMYGLR